MRIRARFTKLTNWQAGALLSFFGFLAYFDGLKNPFMGDDAGQIVNNLPVHSITHIRLFFEGSTFYTGQGYVPLSGAYFRPLMTTVFSLLYTIFGAHPFYFHLLQLLLGIASSFLLYLFFKYSFKPWLALVLALVFLLHPIDSQVLFGIPEMQDVLYFFFGMLGLWLLVRFTSKRALVPVAICFFLSLLSKETAVLFVGLSLIYLFWWNKERLITFSGIMILPLGAWLALKVHAVGFLGINPHDAPIDKLSLFGRLLNDPAILLFYITKLLFPMRLASGYYWKYSHISFLHFWLPLALDIIVTVFFVWVGIRIRKQARAAQYYTYLFFAIWTCVGLAAHLQVVPLDFTVNEAWFYFSMPGLLGMIGIIVTTIVPRPRFDKRILYGAAVLLVLLLGVSTGLRGRDYSSAITLAQKDVAASQDDYIADNDIAIYYAEHNNVPASTVYAERSVAIFPYATNYDTLGSDLLAQHNYKGAYLAYVAGLKILADCSLVDNLALVTPYYGSDYNNTQFLVKAVSVCPGQVNPWLYLAIVEYKDNNSANARYAIQQAYTYDPTNSAVDSVYQIIANNEPLPQFKYSSN